MQMSIECAQNARKLDGYYKRFEFLPTESVFI